MKKIFLNVSLFISLTLCSSFLWAQNTIKDSLSIPKEEKSITHHVVTIDGKTINYTATAGALILRNDQDEPIAFYGYTAYTKEGQTEMDKRPISFSYNGGPGSSSMWLHMGAMGPRRVVLNDPNDNHPAPYKVEDNQFSILDVSDIVMIDPVGTGLSKAIGKAVNKDFWGVDGDIKSVSGFIKQYINENSRWQSPKYLMGESYGTLRSAGVANYLQEHLGIVVNGIVLISTVLDMRTLTFQQGDDISYILNLPTYAVAAWYHNKINNKPKDIATFAEEARKFAAGNYATALIKGSDLTDNEKELIAAQVATMTGLSKEYVMKANLRINEPQFTEELLRSEHLTVGRLDARYKGINQNLLNEGSNYDPQSASISPPYIAAFSDYYYNELKVDKKLTYKISAYSTPGFNWDWKHNKNNNSDAVTPNTAVDLAEAMSHNPALKVLSLNGYYDLATPFFAAEYTFKHMGLEKRIQNNFELKYYEAGHMMYIDPASGKQFKKDIATFIKETSK
ncbi:MAG: carboxypeptidase [Bacteroidota bacterium]